MMRQKKMILRADLLMLLMRLFAASAFVRIKPRAGFITSPFRHQLAETNDVVTRAEAIARSLVFPLGFAAAFRTGAAIAVIGQPRLPSLPPQQKEGIVVGSKVIRLPSGARVRLFYPSQDTNSSNVAPYCTDGRATSDGMAGLVGFHQLGLSFLLAHLADASSGCYENVPPIDDKLPILVYSHGYGGNMDMGCYFLRALASTGMVIAAVEHADGTASSTVLKDGSVLPFSPGLQSGRDQLSQRADELLEASMLSNLPPELQIHPSRVFLGGHSYGAPSALLAAARSKRTPHQPNIAGLILHDPALGMGYGMLSADDLSSVPTISYTSDEYNRAGVRCGDVTLHVRGAYHGNFVDAPLWAPSWVMRPLSTVIPAAGPADPTAVHQQLAASAAAFVHSKQASLTEVMPGNLFEYVG